MARPAEKIERTGKEKAAMLLISLGPEKSAEIFKHLKEEEIEELTLEIANIRAVSPSEN
jgi:flagellar motor switch protein FliG